MKKLIALAALSTFALAACKDNTQAQLEQQQKQIEALQQQLAQQNSQQEDNTVYQLTPEAVKDTIPAEAQANGNNGQPVQTANNTSMTNPPTAGCCKAWWARQPVHLSATHWRTNSHRHAIKTARLPVKPVPTIIKPHVQTDAPANN